MRILAIQLKRIGDLILTLPALHALRSSGAHVTLAMGRGAADLRPAMADSVDDCAIKGQNVWSRTLRGGFDACVDFTGTDRSAALALASRAGRRVIARDALRGKGRWRAWCYNAVVDASVRNRHTVDYCLDHLAPWGIDPGPAPAPALRLPPGLTAPHGLEPGSFAVIHPGAARAEKYWRPERWAEVIDFCQRELALPCVLTGGRGDVLEDRHLAAIRAGMDRPCVDLAGKLDLLTLAATLAEARMVVGVDSGPMHLAAALGTPGIVLFGPTNPFHWRPRGRRSLVLQSGRAAPLAEPDFQQHSPGGPMAGISTAAAIGCIRQLAQAEVAPRPSG